ncbi:MAG: TlpA family protein disulfide reductase [Phycisphaerales bacterium]|nr:TlpA family protein disulfide reductase [Phycisphaerales bacterium]
MRIRSMLTAVLVLGVTAATQAATLKVGDAAPGLDVETWVKGEEVTFQEGQTYVVEFWATWCGPCKRSIPHLSELQEHYGDDGLTIIGITSGEKIDTVERFVSQQGNKMNYTVGFDRRQATSSAWMRAAGLNGIPAAFIVDGRGKIQWIGNPLDEDFDNVLHLVVGGRYDARLNKEAQPMINAMNNARKVGNWRLAHTHLDEIIAIDQKVFAEYTIQKFEMMLVGQGQADAAYEYAEKVMKDYRDDPTLLAKFAEFIAGDDALTDDQRRYDVALELAQAARKVTNRNDPDGYSVEAFVHFREGNLDEAIRLQKRAWMVAAPKRKPAFERVLKSYQAAQMRATASRKG